MFCKSLIKKIPYILKTIDFRAKTIAVALIIWCISSTVLLGNTDKLEEVKFIICFVISIYLFRPSKGNLILDFNWIIYLINDKITEYFIIFNFINEDLIHQKKLWSDETKNIFKIYKVYRNSDI